VLDPIKYVIGLYTRTLLTWVNTMSHWCYNCSSARVSWWLIGTMHAVSAVIIGWVCS